MMNRGFFLSIVLGALLGVTGCGQKPVDGKGAQSVALTITEADNDKTVELREGQVSRIELPGNPTTGYRWDFTAPLDNAVLRLVVDVYEADKTEGKVGVGGKQRWDLLGVAPGKATVALEYKRPWEKDVAPANTMRVTIEVKAK